MITVVFPALLIYV